MRNKLLDSLVAPKIRINTVITFVLSIVLFYYNIPLGILGILTLMAVMISDSKAQGVKRNLWKQYIENITDEMDSSIKEALVALPMPITIIDDKGRILWYNKNFRELLPETDILNEKLDEIIPAVKKQGLQKIQDGEVGAILPINEKQYKIVSNHMDEKQMERASVLYWMDVTNYENLKNLYRDERLCIAYINVDNYEDLLSRSPDEKKSIIASQIEIKIRQEGQKIYASVTKYADDKYFVIFEQKYLEKLETGKFSILDEMREIETDAEFPVSLSMGIGVGGKNLVQLDEYAVAALELALGRGGDQAVVKKITKTEYYGGKLQTVEKRNKGKSKIMAHAIRQLMDQSSGVIIMGHKNPDMDSFGAALGIYRMAKNRNKEAGIVINTVGEALETLYSHAAATKNYTIFNSETALTVVDKDTLLVVVDTHRPSLTECPELLPKVDKIIVIDHHRRMEDSIEAPTLTYMEPYASSTCELVTEILQYLGDKKGVDKIEAEALLAGMTLDTNHFSTKTGVRTFEAASWLRRMGADMATIRQFFQVGHEIYKIKAQAIVESKMIKGSIALAVCSEKDENISLITAMTADELLDIKGTKVAFVIGTALNGSTFVSARSLGDINVQILLEKLGGGGHLNMAGAQVEMTKEEAEEAVKKIIEEAFGEEES